MNVGPNAFGGFGMRREAIFAALVPTTVFVPISTIIGR